MRILAALFLLLLAGCAGLAATTPPGTDSPGPPPNPVTPVPDRLCVDSHYRPVPAQNGTCPPGPRLVVEPLSLDGHLGAQVYVCQAQLPDCQGQVLTPEECEIKVGHPDWTLRAFNVTVAWAADSPATGQLTVEAMVMNATATTLLGSVTGPSPLVLSAAGLNLTLAPDAVFHTDVYNQAGFVSLPGGGVYATPDQAVHIGCNLTFLPARPTR